MATMQGKQALIQLLRQEGVEYVFGIPGATEITFMDALEQEGHITYILGLNECVCAGMAEGYARATDKPGVLNLHTGPGVAAALPMIYNAQAGQVPLVITAGQQHSRLLQQEPHLSGDIVGMGKLYTKWCAEIAHAEDIPVCIQRAFKTAMQYPTGPVMVSLPYDVLEQDLAFDPRPNTTVYARLRPDTGAIQKAFDLLAQAQHPVILVESGVTRCNALEEVVRFAELIGARVYQGWMSDVNFPVTHAQYLGDLDPTSPAAGKVFDTADMLIGIGCSMFAQSFFNPEPTLPKTIRVMHFDENPWEIGKNFPVDCGIHGDIKSALEELNAMLASGMPAGSRKVVENRIKNISADKSGMTRALNQQIADEKDRRPIAVSRLMTEIKQVMTPDTVIVDDCWSSSAMLRQVLDLTRPKSFFRARKGGSIGEGLPMAMGVKLGLPDKTVIAVSGDGSAAWSMQSLWTAAHYQIPVTYVITNNATYRQVKLVRKQLLGTYPLNEKHTGMELNAPVIDFCMLARSMGLKSRKVDNAEDLKPALSAAVMSNEPCLIEVHVENSV